MEGSGVVVERSVRDVELVPSDAAIAGDGDVSQPSGRRPTLLRFGRQPSAESRAQDESRKSRRNKKFAISRVLRRLWIPLVVLVVVGAAGLTVSRLHGIFGSEKRPSYADTRVDDTKPFNPKHLKYEVFGPPGTVADISYFDVDGEPQHIAGATLPWSLDIATNKATIVADVLAQGDSDSLGCRILIDDVVKVDKTSHEVNAFTFCMLKAA